MGELMVGECKIYMREANGKGVDLFICAVIQ